jgi:hypothetical protein
MPPTRRRPRGASPLHASPVYDLDPHPSLSTVVNLIAREGAMKDTGKTRVLKKVAERAETDVAFRQKLVRDLHGKEYGSQKILRMAGARAAKDAAFRQKLILDPHAAIRDVANGSIPADIRIKFVEKDPDVDLMVVLPDLIPEEGELSETDVAAVAGGTNWGCQDVTTA